LERYDLTGSASAFVEGVASAVESAQGLEEAERAMDLLLQSYDVGAGSAGLSTAEGEADLAVSALVLSELGRGYAACVERHLAARGWLQVNGGQTPVLPGLELLSRLLEQHHIHALLRRAGSAVLVSAVSELILAADGQPVGNPRDLLGVQHLGERLPQMARVSDERSWEWQRTLPGSSEKGRLLTLVEAVLV